MNENEKEIALLKKRLQELADKSYRQNVYTFTSFLSMADLSVYYEMKQQFAHVGVEVFGGNELCERKMIRFGLVENLGYEEEFPITLLQIKPLMQKFADQLGHRDFLGAIMNLGIERSTIGDIFIKENVGYVFCTSSIADYLMAELDKIKHTNVKCEICEHAESLVLQEPKEIGITASSERIDGIIAKVYNLSRTQALELFRMGKVFLNGRLCENNSCNLKKDDAVTVRGMGKFYYDGVKRETKKGKFSIGVRAYVSL